MPVLNSASLGAMGSLLWKLDKLLHIENEAQAVIQKLRENVVNISRKLVELSEVHEPPLTVKYWMKDAREFSYDMEDSIDQFVHGNSDAKVLWTDEISVFGIRAEEVMQRYHRFKLEFFSRPTVTNTLPRYRLRRTSDDLILSTVAPVGMEVPRNELLGWLKPNGDNEKELQLKVVSILGVGGVGKSTLAQELWRILGEEFQCRAFVQASKKPNMRMILKSILLQVRPNQPPEDCRVPNLIHDITKQLQDKRYFVIIDDLWAVSIWDTISRSFPDGNCCSRILTTTTIMDVALACCSYDPDYIFKMKSLSQDHSKELFIRTAFGSGIGCPRQFHDFATEITRKCSGLPLAITCIASLVANQPEIVHQGEYVQNFLRCNLRTNPTSVEILKQVLNLCYSRIPYCLKTCLMYLSVYPENYIILKDDLVRQWIAEDFICAMEDKNVFEVATSYFNELFSLGLIQRMDISCNKELSYVVHPMIFDLITCKSIEDNFITIIDYSQSTVALTEKIRRLSLHFGSATYATTPACIGPWQVRSLTFVGLLNCMPSLVDFKLARVVIIHVLDDNEDSSLILTGICVLLWLRYLLIRCNATVELPDQIGCLKFLETLEIHARVAGVPSDIVVLPRLLHLRLGTKRHGYHKHPLLSYSPSGMALSLDDSSRTSSDSIRMFELLGTIPRPPRWIGHFHNLCYLDVGVRELHMFDVDALAELWVLTILSLCVRSRTPTAGDIHFKRGAFPALKCFRYMCSGVIFLTFDKESVPKLWKLTIGFNTHRGWTHNSIFSGIQHLLNLQEICVIIGASFGAEESDRRAAESAFQDAIAKHPCLPKFTVNRCDQVDGKHGQLEKNCWVQEIELSSKRSEFLKQQHGTCKEGLLSNDQPGVQGKMAGDDIEKHTGTRDDEDRETQEEWTSSILLMAIFSATVTYYVGLINSPGSLWRYDGTEKHGGDPVLLTTSPRWCKAFFYCNSVAFMASLVAIILVQKGVRQEHQSLKAAIILQLFGLMGAYAAMSCGNVIASIASVISIAAAVLVVDLTYAFLMYIVNARGKIKEALMKISCQFIFCMMFSAATDYGEYSRSLQVDFHYRVSCSFLPLSIILIIFLVIPNLYRRAFSNEPSVVAGFAAGVYISRTCIGMTEYFKTSIYIMNLVSVTKVFRSVSAGNVVNNDMRSCLTAPPAEDDSNAKKWNSKGFYMVLLRLLTAQVTYHTGLASPLGKVLQGSRMGNPVMHEYGSRPCYLIFLYSNSTSFVASFLGIVLLLLQLFLRKWCLRKVVDAMIVLKLLGLLVAYVASSCRSFKTIIGSLSPLAVTVLAYFVIRVMLSVFNRSKTAAAVASASQLN